MKELGDSRGHADRVDVGGRSADSGTRGGIRQSGTDAYERVRPFAPVKRDTSAAGLELGPKGIPVALRWLTLPPRPELEI